MVSLDSGQGASGNEEQGFFSEDVTTTNEEEELFGHCTMNMNEPQFHQVHTVWVAVLSLICLAVLEVLSLLIPSICNNNRCRITDVSSVVIMQILFWCLALVFDKYNRSQHNKMKQLGYLLFYRETQLLKRSTLIIFSAGNAFLLVCCVIMYEYCKPDRSCTIVGFLHPVQGVQTLVTLEVVLAFPFVIVYIMKIVKFNRHHLPPDIHQEDVNVSYSHLSIPEAEIGFRGEDCRSSEVIEKQGDYIRYLKQHNANLGRKLLVLVNELKSLKSA